jgi:hypothetical protein
MRLAIELIVALNAVGAFGTWIARHFVQRRRVSNLDHVRQLERENKEMDEVLRRLKGE